MADDTTTPNAIVATVSIVAPTASESVVASPATIAVTAAIETLSPYADETYGLLIDLHGVVTAYISGAGVLGVKAYVNPDGSEWAQMHPVLTAPVALSAGAGAVLAGDYGFRGLFTFNPTNDDYLYWNYSGPWELYTPDNWFAGDEGGATILAQWGDFKLTIGRLLDDGNAYKIALTMLTATAAPISATAHITIDTDVPLQIGLGVTRDVTTGTVHLWRSDDRWGSWLEIPLSTSVTPAGALPDSVPDDVTLLSANWSNDTAWVEIFQAQWSESDDINSFDTNEVFAWNYGANISSTITAAVKYDADLAVETDLAYIQSYSRVTGGRTIEGDITAFVPSNATAAATEGTEARFVYTSAPVVLAGVTPDTQSAQITFVSQATSVIEGRASSFAEYDALGEAPRYRLELLRPDGTKISSLDKAVIGPITWELNGNGSFSFTMATLDPKTADIEVPDREVQVWRGDDLMAWGVIVRASGDADTVEFQCVGLGWYLTRRMIGRAEVNHLRNGSFEDNSDYWWLGRYGVLEPGANRDPAAWTSEVRNDFSYMGGKSIYQYANATVDFGINAMQFIAPWEVDPVTSPEGDNWTVSAWCFIPSWLYVKERNVSVESSAITTGLTFNRASTTEVVNITVPGVGTITVPKLIETITIPILDDTPRDVWHRLEATLKQPVNPGVTEWLQVELGTPIGGIFWDEVSMVRDESLYFNNADQAMIMRGLVEHAQDPAYGKNDLRIGTDCPLTGITRTRVFQFFNHEIISDCLAEIPEMWQGLDWDIVCTKTERRYTTYYPMKGMRKPANPLILGLNVAEVSVAVDGEQTSNRIVVMADTGATGASREEAYVSDDTALSDGLILEMAYNALPGSSIPSLGAQADRGLRRYRSPVTIPTVKTYERRGSELLGAVHTGDVVRVVVNQGWIDLDAEYRIIAMTLDPDNETIEFTLNPFEEWNDPTVVWEMPSA